MSQFVRDAIDEKLRGEGVLSRPEEVRAPDRMGVGSRFGFGPTRASGEILNETPAAPESLVNMVKAEVAQAKRRKARK
jgi:hypothetical protein